MNESAVFSVPPTKQEFFAAQINPTKPPLLPPSTTQKLVVPVSTAIFVALVLTSINPPFVQTRMKNQKKNKPSGNISWLAVIFVSIVAGVMAWMLPKLSKYVSGE